MAERESERDLTVPTEPRSKLRTASRAVVVGKREEEEVIKIYAPFRMYYHY